MIVCVLIGSVFKIGYVFKLEHSFSLSKENHIKHYDVKPIFSFLDMQTCVGKRHENKRAGSEVIRSEDEHRQHQTLARGRVAARFS